MFPAFQPLPQLNEGTNRLKTSHFPLFSLTSGSDHQQTRSFSRAIFSLASYTPRLLTDFIARARTPRESMNESNPTVFSLPHSILTFVCVWWHPWRIYWESWERRRPHGGRWNFHFLGWGKYVTLLVHTFSFIQPAKWTWSANIPLVAARVGLGWGLREWKDYVRGKILREEGGKLFALKGEDRGWASRSGLNRGGWIALGKLVFKKAT